MIGIPTPPLANKNDDEQIGELKRYLFRLVAELTELDAKMDEISVRLDTLANQDK